MSSIRAEIVRVLGSELPRALVALDFDGTLAPIVEDPAAARPADGTVEALDALARAGARIAIITGRDARTAVDLGGFDGVPGLVVAGSYGAETWQDGEFATPDEPPALDALRARLPAVVAAHTADPDVRIEDKGLALVIHARPAGDPAAELDALRDPVGALATELGLETHDGRSVLEIRLPGFDKGGALRRLVARFEPAAVLFAGDDIGDLPAFAAVRELRAAGRHAWGVAVVSAEVPAMSAAADLLVDAPADVVALLSDVAAS